MISSPLFSYLDLVEYLVANGAPATIASRTVHDVAEFGVLASGSVTFGRYGHAAEHA